MKKLVMWAAGPAVAMALTGCGGSSFRTYDVDVSLDPALVAARGGSVAAEVDLIGVPEAQAAQWRAYSLGSYFGGDDPMRAGAARHPIVFKPGAAQKQTLSRTDPVWNQWKQQGATSLVVMSQWPGGSAREVLPLDAAAWQDRRIGIVVQKSGLAVEGRAPDKSKP
ncbi:MAG: hypothetical protein IT436_18225 [Phycisphaerales bacterium]|nr:hypothetical protein [Phycisphaerales bacterium]